MVDPTDTFAQMVPNVNAGQIWMYVGIAIIFFLIIIVGAIMWYYMSFKMTIHIFPIRSGGNSQLSVGRRTTNKIKWIRGHTTWRAQWPLMNRKNREPFSARYIYPGNEIYAFEIDGEWIPAELKVNGDKKVGFTAHIDPVPYFVRNWQATEFKNNAEEYAKHDWWTDNKAWVYSAIMFGICAGMLVATTYLIGKYWMPVKADVATIASAAQTIGTAPIGPH
jgi:hypothetical protein